MIKQFLNWIGTFFERLTSSVFGFLSKLFGYLFQKLFDLLKFIFRPIFILIGIIFYFIYKVAELAITLIKLLLAIGKLFFALIKGLFLTLAGFSFTAAPRNDGQWTSIFQNVTAGLESYQFDALSYVLLFLIWFSTAFAAVKILSSTRGGTKVFFDLIPSAVRNFIDSIFNPPLKFLQLGINYLDNVSLIAGHGINLNKYFGFISYLPGSMQAVVNSLLASIVFLATLQLVKAIIRQFFIAKDALFKWQ